jgi:Tat protein translocase TatB subunit
VAASSLSLVFGSIGGPEVILLFIAALLLFGPRRLPEIGRTLGKTVADFRRATNDFRMNLEREVRMDELKETIRPIESVPRPETLARGVLQEVTAPAAPAPAAESDASAPSNDNPAIDGGPSSVH